MLFALTKKFTLKGLLKWQTWETSINSQEVLSCGGANMYFMKLTIPAEFQTLKLSISFVALRTGLFVEKSTGGVTMHVLLIDLAQKYLTVKFTRKLLV